MLSIGCSSKDEVQLERREGQITIRVTGPLITDTVEWNSVTLKKQS